MLKDGVRSEASFLDYPQSAGQSTEFSIGAKETILDNFLGEAVRVQARDRHGNAETVVALERSNFWGQVAGKLGEQQTDAAMEQDLGTLSGFTVGAGESAEAMNAVLEDPLGFLHSLQRLAQLLENLGLLEKLIRMLPQAIQRKQDLNNPYDPTTQTELYESYRAGWYAGYGSYFVVSMVAGQQATKAVKSSQSFARLVEKLDGDGTLASAGRFLQDATRRMPGSGPMVGYRYGGVISRPSDGLDSSTARAVLSETETVGKQYHVGRLLRRVDACDVGVSSIRECGRLFDGLSDEELKRVGRLLGESGDDGAYVLGQLGEDGREQLVRLLDEGEMDAGDVRAMARMLRGEEEYVDEAADAEDLIEIVEEGGELSNTQIVVKRGDKIRWLDHGGMIDGGWLHIMARHITGSLGLNEEATSFFPLGQTVQGRRLPDGLDESELQEMVFKAVKQGEETPQGLKSKYYFKPAENGYPNSGIDEMKVIIEEDGSIETTYPLSGEKVRKWLPAENNGHGGWEDE